MRGGHISLIEVLLFAATCPAPALPLDPCGLVEAPPGLELSISNDAFGPGPVEEWDDLRTFGGNLATRLDSRDAVEASFNAFTHRSSAPQTGSRIDRIELRIRSILLQIRSEAFRLTSAAAVGMVGYGSLEGLAMQEKLHDGVGVSRPAPQSYDPQRFMGVSGALEIQLAPASPALVVPSLVAAAAGEVPGSWQAEMGAEAVAGGTGSGMAAWVTCRYRSGGVSPAADHVSSSMCGPVTGLSVCAGLLTASIEVDPLAGATLGSFGLRIDPQENDVGRGPPLALEIFSNLPVLSPGRRVLFPLFGPDLRGYVEAAHGWWGTAGTGDTGIRYAEYGAGLEGRMTLPLGPLTAEIGCGAGPVASIVTLQPTSVERSRILDTAVLLGLRLQSSLRLGFDTKVSDGARARSGIGASFCVDVPPVPVRPFRSTSAAANQVFKVRVFLYSEAL